MIKFKWIYITIGVLLLSLLGCEKLIFDPTNEETPGAEPKVHLSVNVRAAQPKSGLRSSSINTETDFEDHVHSLGMIIFDSEEGDIVGTYFNDNLGSGESTYAFTVEMKPGNYDFYFVANVPDLATGLAGVTNTSEMVEYMNTVRKLDEDLYEKATSSKGFPMSRVYLNQDVKAGGTIYQPLPFKPLVDGVAKDYVELIRVVAKLEVSLAGMDLDVKDIYFRNANRDYYLVNPSSVNPSSYFNDNTMNVSLRKIDDETYIYYMPEAIIASSTWNPLTDNKPINYFTIETNGGTKYDIPIISIETSITSDYLKKATGQEDGFTPIYTIKRNDHYQYVVRNLEKIEILYIVKEWELVNKALYMGYGYNVEIEGTNVSIKNTVEACDPYHVRLETVGEITFNDGETIKDFTNVNTDASISFELSAEPETEYGEYLHVYFIDVDTDTDTPVHRFSK